MLKYLIPLLIILHSCGPSSNTNVESRSSFIIFGDDDRVEVSKAQTPSQRLVAQATAAIIRKENMNVFEPISEIFNICSDQKYASQNSIGECTAFLIGEDLMMTAGHCLEIDDISYYSFCDRFNIVFDYKDGNADLNDIYECSKVEFIRHDLEESADIGIFRLKRKANGRTPLKITKTRKLDEKLIAVGSPLGAPLKVSTQGLLRKSTSRVMEYDLDLFGGNSGSPIYSIEQGAVIGVHTYGYAYSIDLNSERGCKEYTHCDYDQDPWCQLGGGHAIDRLPEYIYQKYK